MVRRTMFKMRIGSTWCRTDQYLRSTVAEGTRENVKESGQGCGKKETWEIRREADGADDPCYCSHNGWANTWTRDRNRGR